MSILKSLLSKGYFPKELPPAFQTDKLAQVLTDSTFSADTILVVPNSSGTLQTASRKGITSQLCRHNLATLDGTSRPLHIPHPAHFFYLCQAIEKAWNDINTQLSKAELSISKPKIDTVRAFVPEGTGASRLKRRLEDRAQGNYLIKADVANYYGSIYTHSVPWALHTKPIAKMNRGESLIGNLIDRYLHNGQDGQTIGIPVGNDASFIIAELILSAIDQELQSKYPKLIGFRFYDDYEIVCEDEEDAKQVLSSLENTLEGYELRLNRRKTSITRLPSDLDYLWLTEVRRFKFDKNSKGKGMNQRQELIDFANIIFSLVKKYPNDPILRYSLVTMITEIEVVEKEAWETYQHFLLQIYRSEPRLSHLLAHQLLRYESKKEYKINKDLLCNALTNQIKKYALRRATNEVAWAIWIAILLNIRLSNEIASMVSKISDCVVAILALHANRKGLLEISLHESVWNDKLKKKSMYSEDWLLAYEAPSQTWMKMQGSDNFFNNPCFKSLHDREVLFYNQDSYSDTEALLKKLHVTADLYTA